MEMIGAFASGGILAGLLLAVGHWIPAPWGGRMPTTVWQLIGRYIYGVSVLWLGMMLGLWWIGQWIMGLWLLMVIGIGGLVVMLAYGWDRIVQAVRQSRMSEAVDAELQE